MVSCLEYKPELARTFIILQSAFFLLNIENSSAFTAFKFSNHEAETGKSRREERSTGLKYGDPCYRDKDCDFYGAICNEEKCRCRPDLPATNRKDRCGLSLKLNETCEFDEQCETSVHNSMCKNHRCVCRGDGKANLTSNDTAKCDGRRISDACSSDEECGFKHAVCERNSCQCHPRMSATNHWDRCGERKNIDEECFFNEQCEQTSFDTVCINGRCGCRSERTPVYRDGGIKCIVLEQPDASVQTDPAMIVVLSVMCLMFIIICVVLHSFSKARWRENRTIFNTPNPRLMNVSLLREKKTERRGSKEGSCKVPPSREPSIAALRQHSPSLESKHGIGRRESSGGNSNGSAKSPTSRASSTVIHCDAPSIGPTKV